MIDFVGTLERSIEYVDGLMKEVLIERERERDLDLKYFNGII